MKKKKNNIMEENSEFSDIIDLTPVINVALILVVIFLCVCPMTLMTGIKASESKTGAGIGKTAVSDNVRIVLTKDNVIKINENTADKKNLSALLRSAIIKSKTKNVMITADNENLVNDVVGLLDTAKQNGAEKVILMRPGKEN